MTQIGTVTAGDSVELELCTLAVDESHSLTGATGTLAFWVGEASAKEWSLIKTTADGLSINATSGLVAVVLNPSDWSGFPTRALRTRLNLELEVELSDDSVTTVLRDYWLTVMRDGA